MRFLVFATTGREKLELNAGPWLLALKADADWYRGSKYFFWFIAKSDLVSSFWKGDSEEFKGSRIPAAELHVLLCLAVSLKALVWYFSSFFLSSGPLLKQVAQMSCRDKLTNPKVEVAELIWERKWKIAPKLVWEPYTVFKAAAIAGIARVAFPFLVRW